MKQTIDAVVESGLRDRVKIMVGGAPVTKNYAKEIGADGYAPDAGSATKLAKALLQGWTLLAKRWKMKTCLSLKS
jgi:5-methyltetrahydrofolate--homocysteine methyltransferase